MTDRANHQPAPLDYGRPTPPRGVSLATILGIGGILVGLIMIGLSLVSIAFAAESLRLYEAREQDRSAARAAREAERNLPAGEPVVVIVPEPPTPYGAIVGVGFCVGMFILNMMLGIVLIGAAAMMLRGSTRGQPLMALWARAQIIAALLTGAAWLWLLGFLASREDGVSIKAILLAMGVVLIFSFWPVVLLMVMRVLRRAGTGAA